MKNRRHPIVTSDINVTPMVDVMLVLLIIFMVITPMLTKGAAVEMVKAKNPIAMKDADKEDAILVAVTRDGKIFLSPGNKQITVGRICPARFAICRPTSWTKRFISRPICAPSTREVEDVVDNLRAAGVDQLGLLTELAGADKKKAAAPAPAANKFQIFSQSNKENFYVNGSGWGRWRSEVRHQHDASDRRATGAFDHLHGDHAADAAWPGGARAPAAAAERAAAAARTGPHRGDRHRQGQVDEAQPGPDHRKPSWATG